MFMKKLFKKANYKHQIQLLFLGVFGFVIIYFPAWGNPFFQDDFLLLELSHDSNINSFSDYFMPIEQNFHYRPLAFNVYYHWLQSLFGLNYQAFHLVNMIWLILMSGLVYLILVEITQNKKWALWGAMVYLVAPIHFMTQFWLATFNNTQAASFLFLAFYLYLIFTKKQNVKFLLAALAVFTLALLLNESVIVLPGLIGLHLLLVERVNLKTKFLRFIPWLILSMTYYLWRSNTIGFPQSSDYSMIIDFNILATIRWYLLRALGLPEGISFVPFKEYVLILVFIWFLMLAFAAIRNLYLSFSHKRLKDSLVRIQSVLFGLGWFLVGGSIFFLLSAHMSGYYIEIAFLGMLLLWIQILSIYESDRFRVLTLGLWLIISLISIRSMQATHWVVWRADHSHRLMSQIEESCDQIQDSTLSLELQGIPIDEAKVVLSDQSAGRVVCNRMDLKTVFE